MVAEVSLFVCERRIILEGIQYRRIPTKFTTEISQNNSILHIKTNRLDKPSQGEKHFKTEIGLPENAQFEGRTMRSLEELLKLAISPATLTSPCSA
jgi:hypothetical protein